LRQKDKEDRITVQVLLNSRAKWLVITLKFAKKHKFKKKKLERLIYIRNVNGIFNHKELIEYIVEVELFYRRHKEKTQINVIGDQK